MRAAHAFGICLQEYQIGQSYRRVDLVEAVAGY